MSGSCHVMTFSLLSSAAASQYRFSPPPLHTHTHFDSIFWNILCIYQKMENVVRLYSLWRKTPGNCMLFRTKIYSEMYQELASLDLRAALNLFKIWGGKRGLSWRSGNLHSSSSLAVNAGDNFCKSWLRLILF